MYRLIYISIFVLCSCDNFVLKKENKEEIVKEELQKLNKNEVEQPPLFEACKNTPTKELEACFQKTITLHLHNYLMQHTLKATQSVHDTIWVPLLITKDAEIILEDFGLPETIESQIPDLKDIIEKGVKSLPKVEPAHTRSTPVNALYKLPIVIKID